MKANIIKDCYSLMQQKRWFAAFIVIYIALGVANGSASFISGAIGIIAMVMLVNVIGLDEKAKWNMFALTTPITRRNIVDSKYVMLIGLFSVGCLLNTVCYMIIDKYNLVDSFLNSLIVISVMGIMIAVAIPSPYKFGSEKMSYIMAGMGAAVFLIVVCFEKIYDYINIDILETIEQIPESLMTVMVFIVFIAAMVISRNTSIRIFENKDI